LAQTINIPGQIAKIEQLVLHLNATDQIAIPARRCARGPSPTGERCSVDVQESPRCTSLAFGRLRRQAAVTATCIWTGRKGEPATNQALRMR